MLVVDSATVVWWGQGKGALCTDRHDVEDRVGEIRGAQGMPENFVCSFNFIELTLALYFMKTPSF